MSDIDRLVRARVMGASGAGRKIRIDAGLSLPEMATAVGVDPATLSRWETGSSRPRSANALRWVRELDRVGPAKRRALNLSTGRLIVYVASPLASLIEVTDLDRALGLTEERYPGARVIDGARRFRGNDDWRKWWPFVARTMHVLIVFPAADMTVGTGVHRELADARRRDITVEFLIDGAFLPDDGNVTLVKIEDGFTSGRAYRLEVG